MAKKRDTGTELLRIIAMIMIVSSHFALHGGIDFQSAFTANNIFVNAMEFGGKIGVNIFVLITGYYSCESKFSFSRIFKLLFSVEFYSILLAGIGVLVGAVALSKKMLLQAVFPMIFGEGYWFIVIYVVLYCISPLINGGLEQINKRTHGFIVMFLLSVYCFLPNTFGMFKKLNDFGFSNLMWFVTLYLVGAYFRKYSFVLFNKKLTVVLMWASVVVMLLGTTLKLHNTVAGNEVLIVNKIGGFFGNTGLSSFMSLAVSTLMFIVFKGKNYNVPNWVLCVAKSTFGVYLIHDNQMFRTYMWENICVTTSMVDSVWFIAYAIACVVVVFAVCSAIEILREKWIERKLFSNNTVKSWMENLNQKLYN